MKPEKLLLPHVGWLLHEPEDDVARFLNEGWYEYREQAFLWLYAREGDVFVDGGAHFGLYSALYATATQGRVKVWAVEPNPSTRRLLTRNLKLCKLPSARVVPCAIGNAPGRVAFYPGTVAKAAYGGLKSEHAGAPALEVPAITLDQLCQEHAIGTVSLVKLDIEGAEIDALRGARASIAAGRFPVLMVEFTEQNLERFGLSTRDLFDDLESYGNVICRFDEERLRLAAVQYSGPVWYDNYFAVSDIETVNHRLALASPAHRRIARELLRRGAICSALYSSAGRADEATRRAEEAVKTLDAAYARIGEANWRADELQKRLLALQSSAYVRLGRALRLLASD